ncbi:PTS transporter subunit EIIC [Spiroplasma endosymbiont of Panorpa germanica]|uniref:PTS transporter subunit EIIC n=1 Tax=Spiroplasma endosymbiont of Panorpa germanica TaxID=3066314 RepID=UPI0030D284D0
MSDSKKMSSFAIKDFNAVIISGVLKKIGSSLFVIIILMPFFGLALSIGNIIATANGSVNQASKVFTTIGGILFKNLGFFFCLALIFGFTKNKSLAIIAGAISYIIFIIFISSFIRENSDGTINLWFYKNQSKSLMIDSFFGIPTLQTGVLGGMIIGLVIILFNNYFRNIKAPSYLSFIRRESFILLISPIIAIGLAAIFILVWPLVIIALNIFGSWTTKLPWGIDSFIFKFVQRVLVIFQGQVIWHGPFWWTSVGGSLIDYQYLVLQNYVADLIGQNSGNLFLQWGISDGLRNQDLIDAVINEMKIQEYASFIPQVQAWWYSTGPDFWNTQGDQIASVLVLNNNYVNIQDFWAVGLKLTRFTSGGFSNSMIVLPAIAFGMFLNLDKNSQKERRGYFIVAALMSSMLGITEPIEFLFLYSNPLIYFGFYAPMAGLQAMVANLLEIKIGSTFSTGLLDFVTNGILPSLTNQNQDMRIWLIFVVGIVAGVICFVTFWLAYKKTSIKLTLNQNLETLKMKNEFLKEKVIFQELNQTFGGKKNILKLEIVDSELFKIALQDTIIDFKMAKKNQFIEYINLDSKAIIVKINKNFSSYGTDLWIYSFNESISNSNDYKIAYKEYKKELKLRKLT